MKSNSWSTETTDNLLKSILTIKDLGEARSFFRDLLTEEEIKEFGNRWKVAQMLSEKIPYSKIESETGMSTTTIARISKWLNNGMNGYKLIINRVGHHSLASAG